MSYDQTPAGYLRDRARREMKDELRDALFFNIGTIEREKAESIADAIADAIAAYVDARLLDAAKSQAAEPRRNPYEDNYVDRSDDDAWTLYSRAGDPIVWGTRQMCERTGERLMRAWNEGAQTGERDA